MFIKLKPIKNFAGSTETKLLVVKNNNNNNDPGVRVLLRDASHE